MTALWKTIVKVGIFGVVMVLLTVALFAIFGQYRTGTDNEYSALFSDVSSLKSGDSVRVAGVRVGTVNSVSLQPDNKVVVDFDADRDIVLTSGTKAAVRYLNLVGDRYLELVDSPGSARIQQPGSQIPLDRTEPALDLDLLLGGLKPVIQGLNPQDVNALTNSLIQILQGQDGNLESLFSKTSSFSNSLADNGQTVQQLIDNLNTVVATISKDGDKFSGAVDRLEKLITGLSQDRDPIGEAITALDNGTASLTDLLTQARSPLAGTVDQLGRLAPLLDQDKERLDIALQKAPANYRKLVRLGLVRQLDQPVPLRTVASGHRSSGPHRVLPLDRPTHWKVRGALMLKYRGSSLIRAGIIGLVLILLVITVGLQTATAVVRWRRRSSTKPCSPRPAVCCRQRRQGVRRQGGHRLRRDPAAGQGPGDLPGGRQGAPRGRRPPPTSGPERCWASGC